MTRIALAKYLELTHTTQAALGEMVGITQGAVFQMLQSRRNIFVLVDDEDGSISLEEIKTLGNPVPKRRFATAGAKAGGGSHS